MHAPAGSSISSIRSSEGMPVNPMGPTPASSLYITPPAHQAGSLPAVSSSSSTGDSPSLSSTPASHGLESTSASPSTGPGTPYFKMDNESALSAGDTGTGLNDEDGLSGQVLFLDSGDCPLWVRAVRAFYAVGAPIAQAALSFYIHTFYGG